MRYRCMGHLHMSGKNPFRPFLDANFVETNFQRVFARRIFILQNFLLFTLFFLLIHSVKANDPKLVDLIIPVTTLSAEGSFIVPFQIKDGLVLINGRVDSEEGWLVLDSGARRLVLNSQYFQGTGDASSVAYGLGGNISTLSKIKNAALEFEEVKFERIGADIIDLQAIENSKKVRLIGLLGYEVLNQFEVMYNYREGYLTFSAIDDKGEMINPMPHTQLKVDSMSFSLGNFIPVLTVTINGIEKKMGLDTGAEINLLHINNNDDILGEFNVMRSIKITGSDGRKKEALAGKLYRLKVFDKYTCAAMSTMLSNLENFHTIYNTKIDGILGFEFLSPWITSINYKKKMFYLHSFKTERP